MEIEKTKPKGDILESGYYTVFGNEDLAKLAQKIQSTCIINGNELENIIYSEIKHKKYTSKNKISFEEFIKLIIFSNVDIYFKSLSINKKYFLENNIIFSGKNKMVLDSIYYCVKTKTLHIGEIKSGMNLDTKKSEKEIEGLSEFRELCSNYLPNINIFIALTLFTCTDLSHSSIKTNRTDFEKYTGDQFCELVGISYDTIVEKRKKDQEKNVKYFFDEVDRIKNKLI